ncbi:preprotein translocase subunit SecG [Porphyrobacter sp. ULC335]|uniref:preprotein translocase subunit SecG n=1 Tax=Porphyrobacter sp. ULC335 TaxID=2854260 RepID=UPI002220A314|nr:preprotein translocase subunit SecG [Porphyrobacter sp. ULC335]UYV14854.1 preprotein translocase subunit SecG [Porphyrobacter sp. ULC335]
MSLFLFLTVIQALVAAALVGVVLMQRSEGGGLGIGSSPGGAFGARGAADFLTRSTKWLAVAFVTLSIVLAALAVRESRVGGVTTTLERGAPAPAKPDLLADPIPAPAQGPAPAAPAEGAPAAPAGEGPAAQ